MNLGIAASILDCVQAEAARHPDGRITKVGVKMGELAGVDRDALQFGFEVLVKDTNGSRWCWRWNTSRGCSAARSALTSSA